MNTHKFNITGGYPLETDTLDEIQNAYSIFNALGEISGDKTIIRGCTLNGSTVSNGFVYIAGEFFEFRGGLQQSKVIIRQEAVSKPFQNGEENEVLYKRYVTFGTGSEAINWSEFIRIEPVKSLQSRILPPGTNPQLYYGSISNIPNGWQLCDGTNGTPDLRSKFIVGYDPRDADYDTIGDTGGEKKTTLTTAQLPSHNFSGSVNLPPHTHGYRDRYHVEAFNSGGFDGQEFVGRSVRGSAGSDVDNRYFYYKNATTSSAGGGTVSFTTNNKGSGQSHENRPPYYTLAYIIYKG
ncbi:hypothetical protein [Aquimarina algiphila]|uniref:hypothetical protein n=1 Tax=Aquimarina algiphila TaxID=2047982 RepID=UPI00232B9567|nr:hypothetical protein [Aquimarina algiphila]